MPKVIKRSTKGVTQRFGFYEGEEPPAGVYRGIIKSAVGQMSSGGNVMLYNVVELQAREGDGRAKYDGYGAHVRIVWGDHDSLKEREQAYYLAVCGKEDADVVFAGDPTKFKAGDKQSTPITKVGGQNPVGKVVLVRLKNSQDPQYPGMDADGIYPTREETAHNAKYAGKKVDTDDDIDDEESDEGYTQEELNSKSLAALRKILVEEFDADADEVKSTKKKSDLVDMIIDAQFDSDEEDEEDDEEEEDLDEEEEDEDLDEEDEDAEAELREELGELTRAQLKARLRKWDKDFKVTTKTTEEQLIDRIVEIETDPDNPPF